MRIAVLGAEGQLGSDLQTAVRDEVVPLGHEQIEITDPANIHSVLTSVEPDCLVNAAAWNQVDRAEDDPAAAYAVNAIGPRNLARFCENWAIPLLHVSTDYVFGLQADRGHPYREEDSPGPVSAYGTSKLAGEYFVRSLCRRHVVVRTCGLYGQAGLRRGGNFVETMLRLAEERRQISVVDDQWCTPTATADLALALAALLATDAYGVYHATNAGQTTWCRFAREIFHLTGRDVEVEPITSVEYGAPARRPAYSVLDNRRLEETIGFRLPDWRNALARYLSERSP